jgi:hypothetical protein
LEITEELYKWSKYLASYGKYRKDGLSLLKKTYAYASNLEEFILKNYGIEKGDKKNQRLIRLKIDILA